MAPLAVGETGPYFGGEIKKREKRVRERKGLREKKERDSIKRGVDLAVNS